MKRSSSYQPEIMAEENIGICLSGQSRRRAVPHRGWGERAVASGGQRHKYGNADSARDRHQSAGILNARVVLGNTRRGSSTAIALGNSESEKAEPSNLPRKGKGRTTMTMQV